MAVARKAIAGIFFFSLLLLRARLLNRVAVGLCCDGSWSVGLRARLLMSSLLTSLSLSLRDLFFTLLLSAGHLSLRWTSAAWDLKAMLSKFNVAIAIEYSIPSRCDVNFVWKLWRGVFFFWSLVACLPVLLTLLDFRLDHWSYIRPSFFSPLLHIYVSWQTGSRTLPALNYGMVIVRLDHDITSSSMFTASFTW